MTVSEALLPVLACPTCSKTGLRPASDSLDCLACGKGHPSIEGVSCLVADPSVFRAEWRVKLEALLEGIAREEAELRSMVSRPDLLVSTRSRLKSLARAKASQHETLVGLLEPLLRGAPLPESVRSAFPGSTHTSRLPMSYLTNLFRDWSWGEAENRFALDCVVEATTKISREPPATIAVLGAGAGRLAYDLHRHWQQTAVLALDINPILLLAAARIWSGGRIEIPEFPLAPSSSRAASVRRTLQAPAPADSARLMPLFADGIDPPFAPGSLDVIVTPWFLDILPEDARLVARRINAALKPGGTWIYHGSVAFAGPRAEQNYSFEELDELLGQSGFEPTERFQRETPYLQCPESCQRRSEKVLTLAAQKTAETAPAPSSGKAAPWLDDPSQPVTLTPQMQNTMQVSQILLAVLSQVDGRRTLPELSLTLSRQLGMDPATTEGLLRGFLKSVT